MWTHGRCQHGDKNFQLLDLEPCIALHFVLKLEDSLITTCSNPSLIIVKILLYYISEYYWLDNLTRKVKMNQKTPNNKKMFLGISQGITLDPGLAHIIAFVLGVLVSVFARLLLWCRAFNFSTTHFRNETFHNVAFNQLRFLNGLLSHWCT